MLKRVPYVSMSLLLLLVLSSCTPFSNKEEISNPWTSYPSTLSAFKHTRFYLMNAPKQYKDVPLDSVMDMNDGELSEVSYGNHYIFRKGLKKSHISGDYNDYPVAVHRRVHGRQVTYKGDKEHENLYQLFEWNEGLKYSCSVYARSGLTIEEWEDLLYIFS